MTRRIALLYGGASSEHDVSVMGYEYVSRLLANAEYDVLLIYVSKGGDWFIDRDGKHSEVYLTRKGLNTGSGVIQIDCAIPLLHGEGGEDGSIQGVLEYAGIPYVGADVSTSVLCLDKSYAKAVADSLGIPTVKGIVPRKNEEPKKALTDCRGILDFPVFIKPRRLGSSVGASPAQNEDDFLRVYKAASDAGDGLVMIESCLAKKRELECAFVEMNGERIVTPPGEVLIDGFYGYGEKYGGKTRTETHPKIDTGVRETVINYARRLADAFLLRHLGRIDFFLVGSTVFFNEINTFPGFTSESLYPKLIQEYVAEPKDVLLSFIKDALSW